jgi:hypothetical protein
MVTVLSLWLPILVSAVAVFVVSSIIHMVLTYHRRDYAQVPSEDAVMDALRAANLAPGDYMLPSCSGPKQMKDPAFIEKMSRGPVVLMTVCKSGPPNMGASLVQWFIFCVVVGVFAAYVAGRSLGPGAEYLAVFRIAGATAFAGYALGQLVDSIWYMRQWSTTIKNVFDGLIYALVAAGVFGSLWPAA